MTSSSEMLDALRPVVATLRRLGVKHYVGGSVASSVHGVARTTLDVDIIAELQESHIEGLTQALSESFYVSEPMIRSAIVNGSCFNVIHLATSFKVDVFVPKNRPYDQMAMDRIQPEMIGEESGVETWVATPEDVILSKLEWYRLGEEISERQWFDVLSVLRIQQGRLDLDYMRQWATNLGVSDLLMRALAET